MSEQPGLPLTTGEGNTAEVEGTVPSSWLIAEKAARQRAEAECGRLREHAKEQELLAETRKESRRMYRERAEAAEQLAGRLREQLEAARRELTDYQRVVWVAVWNAPGHRLEVFPTMHRDSDMTLIREPLGVEGPAE